MLETPSHGRSPASAACSRRPRTPAGWFRRRPKAPEPGAWCPAGGEASRAPSVWMWPPALGTVVHAAPPSESNAHVFQKHPRGPAQESRLPVPRAPLGSVGGRRKPTTAHAEVVSEENVGGGFQAHPHVL